MSANATVEQNAQAVLQDGESAPVQRICFVCTGNTCRSPMAEKLLDKALKAQKLGGFTVTSAGTAAKRGDTINPKSALVLQENGINVETFKSKKITIFATVLRMNFNNDTTKLFFLELCF